MSERVWKHGAVAMVTISTGYKGGPVVGLFGGSGWHTGQGYWGSVADVRPLVVIDPEDREQARCLLRTYGEQFSSWDAWTDDNGLNIDRLQAALREFANPTPPTVYAHYPADNGDPRKAMCGKVWFPTTDPDKCERCLECTAIVESMWIA